MSNCNSNRIWPKRAVNFFIILDHFTLLFLIFFILFDNSRINTIWTELNTSLQTLSLSVQFFDQRSGVLFEIDQNTANIQILVNFNEI